MDGADRQADQPGGDRSRYAYVRGLLDALLLYYHDRFGTQESDRFASLAARFVMVPRAKNFAVKRETINNHALDRRGRDLHNINLFQEIRETWSAREVVNRSVPRPALYGRDPARHNKTDATVVTSSGSRRGRPQGDQLSHA